MANKNVFQTLEDRGNPDEIEKHGPYVCKRESAWLGVGYYFWDTFINNAHWWGIEGACYRNGYVICKAECDFNIKDCFDLVGETDHIQMFHDTVDLMKKKGLLTSKTTVSRVINYLMDDLKIFNYNAIRAYGVHSKSKNSRYNSIIYFNPSRVQYLDVLPAIQFCFFKNDVMALCNYKIVYPSEYIDGYLV